MEQAKSLSTARFANQQISRDAISSTDWTHKRSMEMQRAPAIRRSCREATTPNALPSRPESIDPPLKYGNRTQSRSRHIRRGRQTCREVDPPAFPYVARPRHTRSNSTRLETRSQSEKEILPFLQHIVGYIFLLSRNYSKTLQLALMSMVKTKRKSPSFYGNVQRR